MGAREYFTLPEGPPWFELVGGELIMSPSPGRFHQEIVGNIHLVLASHVRATKAGWVLLSPSDVELSEEDVYEPDIYFVRRERAAILNDRGARGAPDLVVEVLSPYTARLDLNDKRLAYARAGVAEMWIVQPDTQAIQVWRFDKSVDRPIEELAARDFSILTSPLFPGLEISLEQVFFRD
jgi:Uma2 family endonuclease